MLMRQTLDDDEHLGMFIPDLKKADWSILGKSAQSINARANLPEGEVFFFSGMKPLEARMFPMFVRFATVAATATLVLSGGARAQEVAPDVLVKTVTLEVVDIIRQDKDIQAGDRK